MRVVKYIGLFFLFLILMNCREENKPINQLNIGPEKQSTTPITNWALSVYNPSTGKRVYCDNNGVIIAEEKGGK